MYRFKSTDSSICLACHTYTTVTGTSFLNFDQLPIRCSFPLFLPLRLCHFCTALAAQITDRYRADTEQILGGYRADTRRIPSRYQADTGQTGQIPNGYRVDTRQIPGGYRADTADTRRIPGRYQAGTKQVPSRHGTRHGTRHEYEQPRYELTNHGPRLNRGQSLADQDNP